MNFLKRVLKAIVRPGAAWAALRASWRDRVTLVERDGARYYRYRGALYPERLNMGEAVAGIREKALQYCAGRGLDVGAGSWPLPGAIPVQEEAGRNAYSLDEFADGSLDFVFSSHCLEHLDRWPEALALWSRKLKPGGVMFLYLPHESMLLWRPGAPWVKDHHKWIPTAEAVAHLLAVNGLELAERGPERDEWWSFYLIARKPGGSPNV